MDFLADAPLAHADAELSMEQGNGIEHSGASADYCTSNSIAGLS